jgi:hypothetical protein
MSQTLWMHVRTTREIKGGNDGKPLDGIWVCTNCDNVEAQEREVGCWYCGKGEMYFLSNAELFKIREKAS